MDFHHFIEGFNKGLEDIENGNDSIYNISISAIKFCRKSLKTLKKEIIENRFKNQKEEIDFFKNIKSVPLSKLIYFKMILSYERSCPKIKKSYEKEYIKQRLKNLQNFILSYNDFVNYLESNQTYLDELYFTRQSKEPFAFIENTIFLGDSEFCTSRDILFSQLTAYKEFSIYLKKKLKLLSIDNNKASIERHNLKWTGNKIDLIELIYALQASGKIQGGTSEIKQVASACEELFNIKLGNYYRKYLEIRSRKIERTKFLNTLKTNLLQKMEEADF